MSLAQEFVKSIIDTRVDLFQLDASGFGEGVIYLTPKTKEDGGNLSFRGDTYLATPMQYRETGKEGSLIIADVMGEIFSYLKQYQGLSSAVLYKFSTLRKFLDDGSDPQDYRFGTRRWEVDCPDSASKSHVGFRIKNPLNLNEKYTQRIVTLNEFPAAGRVRG